ncbi:TPA: hypothetical protein HA361_05445 [Candidatus Woesearchaeota archaeon]|nr:hypothetical protein [Candidatus Woesearchaeota archaeon]HII68303.1 hypothetical protein [Candidatus Woesearchaeota archaeon]
MGIPSKEESVLELFFNEPTRHWHFHTIAESAGASDVAVDKWLKKNASGKLIKRIKPKGKMPYYIANWDNHQYHSAKRVFALNKLHESGLLGKLQSLDHAKAVVVFGSFARSDWHTGSDVDVFVLGDPGDLGSGTLWKGLGLGGKSREVSVHNYPTIGDARNIHSGLMKNVVKGFFVKGNIYDIAEVAA